MLTRSRIIAGASAIAGEPPNEPQPGGVPEWLRYETAADLETELLRDENLSAANRTLASYEVRLAKDQREFAVTQPGLEDPVAVSMRYHDNTQLRPLDIEISNIVLMSDNERESKRAIAFYSDKPQQGMVSWKPLGTEILRFWYDRSPETAPDADKSTFTITESYVPLLKLLLAASMLEMMGKAPGAMLASRIQRGMDQWKRYVKNGKQQGVIKKTPSFKPSRYRVNTDGDFRIPFE
jgi:hypothetical protein